ncbi:chemotaxis protein CheB [Epilithonimonas sp.]|uniref:chemotaxis protein CheB n=1 Tax=Epilithonimonas sp. TaxID=2894511 RepID=UPI00289EA325|nr:chemotaxis protein CheB [Epilithonimonas sp.]
MEESGFNIELVIIGGSAGSLPVILNMLKNLNEPIKFAIVIVIHRKASGLNILPALLQQVSDIRVTEIDDKAEIENNNIYLAPADFHLFFDDKKTMSLDRSEKLNFSRPSIDVSFNSAGEIFGENLLAILLSGANSDGVQGLKFIKKMGGRIWIQDPETAEVNYMPKMAMEIIKYDEIITPEDLPIKLNRL